jgi:2-polyprenyl-3-methyl-5-hydroxy-6-metoxy-1,4-benzoquinol methylase
MSKNQSGQKFYDQYHQKNNNFVKVIGRGNFTYAFILDALHQYLIDQIQAPSKLHILDVGCGVGSLSFYLGKLGAQVTGIDLSPRAIEICISAQKHLKMKNVKFEQGELKKGRGDKDAVLCLEVIEHVPDQEKLLDLLNSQLKKKGLLFLSTPSKENFLYGIGFLDKFDKEVGHLRRYDISGLKKLIEAHGFKIKLIQRQEGPLRNILFTTKLGILIKGLKGPLVPIFHFIDQMFIPFFGAMDILVVAEKR